jgi:hypothetical protein
MAWNGIPVAVSEPRTQGAVRAFMKDTDLTYYKLNSGRPLMKTIKSIYLWVLCMSVLAVALSAPVVSSAASSKNSSSKNSNSKNNGSNSAGNSGGASSNAATTAASNYNTDSILIPANDDKWHTILTTTIKNPTADDDLFIHVSQVTTITTTTVASSSIPNLISSGNAKLQMRVLVDGIEAKPGPIVFDERLMTLTSSLQNFLSLSCTDTPTQQTIVTTSCVCSPTLPGLPVLSCAPNVVPAGYTQSCTSQSTIDTDVVTTCSLVPGADQSLQTVLSHTLGHAFGFLAPSIGGQGNTHLIQVQVMLTQLTTNGGTAQALVGPGTLNINAVNLK